MKLEDFADTDQKYGVEAIAVDDELAGEVQNVLISLKLLDPSEDKEFDNVSTDAFIKFQIEKNCKDNKGVLGSDTAKKLILSRPEEKGIINVGTDFASRICQYMQKRNYTIFTNRKEYNFIYIEGINTNGKVNVDKPNEFNDLRLVLEIQEGDPVIVKSWEATTEPGVRYTNTPMNPRGAARIKFGQYRAWKVGIHGKSDKHQALVQTGGAVSVHRDFNKDFKRTNDVVDTGLFGINQHWGYDYPKNDINVASAGCLVGRTRQGHREFMEFVRQDKRYVENKNYVFHTTIIPGDGFLSEFPPSS